MNKVGIRVDSKKKKNINKLFEKNLNIKNITKNPKVNKYNFPILDKRIKYLENKLNKTIQILKNIINKE
jgi:hypothetical protein